VRGAESAAKLRKWNLESDTLDAALTNYKLFDAEERSLALAKVRNDVTRQAAGSSAEAAYTFSLTREKELNLSIIDMNRTGARYDESGGTTLEYARAVDELKEMLDFQANIATSLDSNAQESIFSKMSPLTAFNGYYESALRTITNAKFTPGIEGQLAQVFEGDKLAGIRAMTSAINAFANTFNKVGPTYQGIINNMVAEFKAQTKQGGQQFLEKEVSRYNIDMSNPSGITDISIQNYFDADGTASWQNSALIAYDSPLKNNVSNKMRGKILYALNPKGVTPKQKAAQDKLLADYFIDTSKLKDDPTTPKVDESIVYAIFAGGVDWVFPPANR
jgi:hypothetical protein